MRVSSHQVYTRVSSALEQARGQETDRPIADDADRGGLIGQVGQIDGMDRHRQRFGQCGDLQRQSVCRDGKYVIEGDNHKLGKTTVTVETNKLDALGMYAAGPIAGKTGRTFTAGYLRMYDDVRTKDGLPSSQLAGTSGPS